VDEDGELKFPPRATLRDDPSWLPRLASIPRNCSGSTTHPKSLIINPKT
jgi:hypothetical protein